MATRRVPQQPSFWPLSAIATVLTVFVGAVVLPFPFFGDQALFAVYARMIDDGAILYRDIWDLKQPGIFFYFLGAGRVFGLTELGIHASEILYLTGNGVMAAVALRSRLRNAWVAALLPVFAVGTYFAVADPNDLTQVEALIGPLMFWVVFLLLPREGVPSWMPFVAGLLTGVITWFKLIAVLVPGLVLAASLWLWRSRGTRTFGPQVRVFGFFALGALIPVMMLWLWVDANDLSDIVIYTWFELPSRVLEVHDRPLSRLIRSAGGFAIFFAAPIALAFLGGWRKLRSDFDLVVLMLTSLLGSTIYILLQLWWGYLFILLVFQVGVVAALGVDEIISRRPGKPWAWVAAILVLALPALGRLTIRTADLAALVSGTSLSDYRDFDHDHAQAREDADAAPVEASDSIYVLGNPSITHLLRADQSIPIHGWTADFWTPYEWQKVALDLSKPGTEALFISTSGRSIAAAKAPWFEEQVLRGYVVMARTPNGTWYLPVEE